MLRKKKILGVIFSIYIISNSTSVNALETTKENDIFISFIENNDYDVINNKHENVLENTNNDYLSWGVEYLGIDKYVQYINNKNFNNSVVIAVIDSGVDYNHPIFKDKLLSNGYDFVNNDNDPYDDNIKGHGTHVTGIIADAVKYVNNIKILPIKALDMNGVGTVDSLANSIRYAIDSKVDVINLSLGIANGLHSKLIEDLILEAINNGIVVVNAVGNSNINAMDLCPAHINEIITVSAIDSLNNKSYTSNYGANVDFAAPGVNIYSAIPNGGYAYKSGTSMAAPYISTIAALIKLDNINLTPIEIENIIKLYSVDIGETGVDWYFGNGVPNMRLAIDYNINQEDINEVKNFTTKDEKIDEINLIYDEVDKDLDNESKLEEVDKELHSENKLEEINNDLDNEKKLDYVNKDLDSEDILKEISKNINNKKQLDSIKEINNIDKNENKKIEEDYIIIEPDNNVINYNYLYASELNYEINQNEIVNKEKTVTNLINNFKEDTIIDDNSPSENFTNESTNNFKEDFNVDNEIINKEKCNINNGISKNKYIKLFYTFLTLTFIGVLYKCYKWIK